MNNFYGLATEGECMTVRQRKKTEKSTFFVELIKPSHYDDDGYVVQWWKSWVPSNSLSVLYGLTLDVSKRCLLGEDVGIAVSAYDEYNTRIPIKQIIRRFKKNGNSGLICLVGVQSNQFPRAIDISRKFRAAGIQVVIGGFHVSGCLSMLPDMTRDLKEAVNLGITLFAGEVEGRLDLLLEAAYKRQMKPIYNFLNDLPNLQHEPIPYLPERHIRRYVRAIGCFDAGRGCPFACSFCTIINVQGRKSRFRDADDIEQIVRVLASQGIDSFFITDDNFARNKNWEPIFDRLAHLREKEGIDIYFVMQVDTLCHKISNFVEKAQRAGCRFVFIGLENINPQSLKMALKGHNRITEYRTMLQAWRNVRVITYCGYILGFPADTPESIERDIKIIQRELSVDLIEYFILTPLPGSQDHKELYLKGVWMDPDLNKYDAEHVTVAHPLMSKEEWQGIYDRAWHLYYSWEHIETLIKRAFATGIRVPRLISFIFEFYGSYRFEKLHPLQCGLFRIKVRTERRFGLPREPAYMFYPFRVWEVLSTYIPAIFFFLKLMFLWWRVQRNPMIKGYSDIAIMPVENEVDENLELFNVTEAARNVVAKEKASKEIRRKVREVASEGNT